MYFNGEGLPKDDEKYLYWVKMAALGRFCRAQYRLGMCYKVGEVVETDLRLAFLWLASAVNLGAHWAESDSLLTDSTEHLGPSLDVKGLSVYECC